MIDSGATNIVIPYRLLTWLMSKGLVTPSDYRGTANTVLADGSGHMTEVYILHSVTIGNSTVTGVLCNIGPDDGSLLLGRNVLEKFGSVTFDYQRNVLRLGP
jgi:predicted aspartyl protease